MSQSFTVSVPKLKHEKLVDAAARKALAAAADYAKDFRWWCVWMKEDADGEPQDQMIFDSETGLLWQWDIDLNAKYNYNEQSRANAASRELKLGGLSGWRVPSDQELRGVAMQQTFPLRSGHIFRLCNYHYFLTQDGHVLGLDYNPPLNNTWGNVALLLPVCTLFTEKLTAIQMMVDFAKRKWSVDIHGAPDNAATHEFHANYDFYKSFIQSKYSQFSAEAVKKIWANIDYTSVRLPQLDTLRFTDVHQGLWEFHSDKSSRLNVTVDKSLRGRDPALDIRDGNIAIDFGTSSTVVAFRDNGRDQLLRIGTQAAELEGKNRKKDEPAVKAEHFENPTILEFVDLKQFLEDWVSEAYRPLVQWDTVHCSHEARASLRNNNTNPKVIGSILLRLKQWALRAGAQSRVCITDQAHGFEYELKALTELNPVKGKALTVDKNYVFDPIELYAWFLGMCINWRQRGLFLHYYMTFPVAYPSEVKQKILASFRRGLQRSLPEGIVNGPRFSDFKVEERASEPAAFAAAALDALKIQPTIEGTAYAVFDFGGGTTDFDYGFYRLPTNKEENEGWEHVLEHFGSSGDRFLGGENLLENMAYKVFCANLDVCRENAIAFTKPLDAIEFPGSEQLIIQTQAAFTNTTIMMSRLRALWETGTRSKDTTGTTKVQLSNRSGTADTYDLTIKEDDLIGYLETRIRNGLHNFLVAMKQSFDGHGAKSGAKGASSLPKEIHVLLAGNSSRSPIVLGLLGNQDDERGKKLHEIFRKDMAAIFGSTAPKLIIHKPLEEIPNNPYSPTAKTGVALGLLRVCPGAQDALLVVNHAQSDVDASPFQFFVGHYKRSLFDVRLKQGDAYKHWRELGAIREGVYCLPYSTAPRSTQGKMSLGDNELFERKLNFAGDTTGQKVYVQAIGPNEIEVCMGASLDEVIKGGGKSLQRLKLA